MDDIVLNRVKVIVDELNRDIKSKLDLLIVRDWSNDEDGMSGIPIRYIVRPLGNPVSRYECSLELFGEIKVFFVVKSDGVHVLSDGKSYMRIDSELSRQEVIEYCKNLQMEIVMNNYASMKMGAAKESMNTSSGGVRIHTDNIPRTRRQDTFYGRVPMYNEDADDFHRAMEGAVDEIGARAERRMREELEPEGAVQFPEPNAFGVSLSPGTIMPWQSLNRGGQIFGSYRNISENEENTDVPNNGSRDNNGTQRDNPWSSENE